MLLKRKSRQSIVKTVPKSEESNSVSFDRSRTIVLTRTPRKRPISEISEGLSFISFYISPDTKSVQPIIKNRRGHLEWTKDKIYS